MVHEIPKSLDLPYPTKSQNSPYPSLFLLLGLTEDEEKELERLYRAGRSYVALSAETLNLFGYMSEGCYKLMCDETLVTRIAEMANYFLDLLVGKKRKTLKVSLVNTSSIRHHGDGLSKMAGLFANDKRSKI